MKVQFENGYTAEMRDDVAKKYIAKGRVKKVVEKEDKPAPTPRPRKTEDPKPEKREAE